MLSWLISLHSGSDLAVKPIQEFVGDGLISKIRFKDKTEIDVDGVFVAQGNLSSFELTKQLGLIDKNNFIMVDSSFMTNVAGAFCAGDMIGGLLQISKAVSDGANAGLEAVRYIKIMEIENEWSWTRSCYLRKTR